MFNNTNDHTKLDTENDKKINFQLKLNSEIRNNNKKLNSSNNSQEEFNNVTRDPYKNSNFSFKEFVTIKKIYFLKNIFFII